MSCRAMYEKLQYTLLYIPADDCDMSFISGPLFVYSGNGPDMWDVLFSFVGPSWRASLKHKAPGHKTPELGLHVKLLWSIGRAYIAWNLKGVSLAPRSP